MDKVKIRHEIRDLEKQQTDLWVKIITLVRQSQAVEIIKLTQNKTMPLPLLKGGSNVN